ncbi:tRNA-intron endonuclease catalytic domain-like protein [Auriscalpium vulgare]|uniref:tRNA-intron endonuclease catalytic domain-like protein n=1 Tax=Auriscalpium vulgare TaxID=40419 RepID=A0ACB8S1S6_9AGAM|nr:tRNA-intron endonuclease catalytic domain-like protein [Auriscalpium vulgare]
MTIPIHVSHQRAFIWDVDRTLPHLSQQNVFLGLPLVLMPEEVVLLVDKQLAVLVDDLSAHRTPTAAQIEAWDQVWKKDIAQQVARLEREASVGKEDRSMSEAAVEKRKAREEKRRLAIIQKQQAEGESADSVFAPPPAPPPESSAGQPASSNIAYSVAVPTTSEEHAWYNQEGSTYATLEAARSAGIWSYPATEEEVAKCAVFRDLWEQGYYMGGGSKFGGEWLVYPGDPLRYHSHFVATVLASPTAPLRPMEIVAHGRLGTATKKAHLLCGYDPATKKVAYFSVEWAGFG